MNKLNLEGKVSSAKNEQTTFSVNGAENMTIDQLIERIRGKIQQVQEKKARQLNSGNEELHSA